MQIDPGDAPPIPADEIYHTVHEAKESGNWTGPVDIPINQNVHVRILRIDGSQVKVAIELYLRDPQDRVDITHTGEGLITAGDARATSDNGSVGAELDEPLMTPARDIAELASISAFLRGLLYDMETDYPYTGSREAVGHPDFGCLAKIDADGTFCDSDEIYPSGPCPFNTGAYVFVTFTATSQSVGTADVVPGEPEPTTPAE